MLDYQVTVRINISDPNAPAFKTSPAFTAAFGQGDIPTILGHLAESIEWETGGWKRGTGTVGADTSLVDLIREWGSL